MNNEQALPGDESDIIRQLFAELEADIANSDRVDVSLLILQAVHRGAGSKGALAQDFLGGGCQSDPVPTAFFCALRQLIEDGMLEEKLMETDGDRLDRPMYRYELTSLGRVALGL